jgi:hypothetical protein
MQGSLTFYKNPSICVQILNLPVERWVEEERLSISGWQSWDRGRMRKVPPVWGNLLLLNSAGAECITMFGQKSALNS